MAQPDQTADHTVPAGDRDAAEKRVPTARGDEPGTEVEVAVVLATFRARTGREPELAGVLARYVVVARRAEGCRNIDLLASTGEAGRIVVVEKWVTAEAARRHLDAPETTEMAAAAGPLLAAAPNLELLDAISAHDLR